ncbi:helix-turn-helix domain-containing protein [Streptomyces sp. NPDC057582]|uniref:helix-turn-helix domain-containing protein n=1 Tax=Streptomyces sp. NPDC057582 TaxID=3346174 RepID=UPI00367C797B
MAGPSFSEYVGHRNRSLTQVAELLGFSALSTFSHWFRNEFGSSPRAWRATQHHEGPRTPMPPVMWATSPLPVLPRSNSGVPRACPWSRRPGRCRTSGTSSWRTSTRPGALAGR